MPYSMPGQSVDEFESHERLHLLYQSVGSLPVSVNESFPRQYLHVPGFYKAASA